MTAQRPAVSKQSCSRLELNGDIGFQVQGYMVQGGSVGHNAVHCWQVLFFSRSTGLLDKLCGLNGCGLSVRLLPGLT